MKKLLVILVTALAALTACKNESATVTPTATVPDELIGTPWTVSSLLEGTEDKTKMFVGIQFSFTSDSKVVASDSKKSLSSGSWSNGSQTYYGNPVGGNPNDLSISLGTATPFNRISKSWTVVNHSSTLMKLDSKDTSDHAHVVLSR